MNLSLLLQTSVVLMLIRELYPFVDCRTACTKCRQRGESAEVLEVYCSMCAECRQHKRDRLLRRGASNSRLRQGPVRPPGKQQKARVLHKFAAHGQKQKRGEMGNRGAQARLAKFRADKIANQPVPGQTSETLSQNEGEVTERYLQNEQPADTPDQAPQLEADPAVDRKGDQEGYTPQREGGNGPQPELSTDNPPQNEQENLQVTEALPSPDASPDAPAAPANEEPLTEVSVVTLPSTEKAVEVQESRSEQPITEETKKEEPAIQETTASLTSAVSTQETTKEPTQYTPPATEASSTTVTTTASSTTSVTTQAATAATSDAPDAVAGDGAEVAPAPEDYQAISTQWPEISLNSESQFRADDFTQPQTANHDMDAQLNADRAEYEELMSQIPNQIYEQTPDPNAATLNTFDFQQALQSIDFSFTPGYSFTGGIQISEVPELANGQVAKVFVVHQAQAPPVPTYDSPLDCPTPPVCDPDEEVINADPTYSPTQNPYTIFPTASSAATIDSVIHDAGPNCPKYTCKKRQSQSDCATSCGCLVCPCPSPTPPVPPVIMPAPNYWMPFFQPFNPFFNPYNFFQNQFVPPNMAYNMFGFNQNMMSPSTVNTTSETTTQQTTIQSVEQTTQNSQRDGRINRADDKFDYYEYLYKFTEVTPKTETPKLEISSMTLNSAVYHRQRPYGARRPTFAYSNAGLASERTMFPGLIIPGRRPTFGNPNAAYASERPLFAAPKHAFTSERPVYADPNANFASERLMFADPKADFASERPKFADLNDAFASERPKFADMNDAFASERPLFADRNDAFASERPLFADRNDAFASERPMFAGLNNAFASERPMFAGPNDAFGSERPMAVDPNDPFAVESPVFRIPKDTFANDKPMFRVPNDDFVTEKPIFRVPKDPIASEKSMFRVPKDAFAPQKPNIRIAHVEITSARPILPRILPRSNTGFASLQPRFADPNAAYVSEKPMFRTWNSDAELPIFAGPKDAFVSEIDLANAFDSMYNTSATKLLPRGRQDDPFLGRSLKPKDYFYFYIGMPKEEADKIFVNYEYEQTNSSQTKQTK